MSEARKLINVIEELEKQSEELNSTIEMYEEIKKLSDEIECNSEKYTMVVDKITQIEGEVSKRIDTSATLLKDATVNLEGVIKNNESFIEDIAGNNELIKTDIINISEYISALKQGIETSNNNVSELSNDLRKINDAVVKSEDILKENVSYMNCIAGNNELIKTDITNISANMSDFKKSIEDGNKNIAELNKEIIGLNYLLTDIKRDLSDKDEKILEIKLALDNNTKDILESLDKQLLKVEENNKKRNKIIYAGIVILIVINILSFT